MVTPTGSFGYPLGTYLTIEGVRHNKHRFQFGYEFTADIVNGRQLKSPVTTFVSSMGGLSVKLPEAEERCIIRGYESGQTIGIPDEVRKAENIKDEVGVSIVPREIRSERETWYKWEFVKYIEVVEAYPITMKQEIDASITEQEKNAPTKETSVPVGILGYPLGSYLTIEGEGYHDRKGPDSLVVEMVNGKKLETPIRISVGKIKPPGFLKGQRYIIRGYESGGMIGSMDAFYKHEDLNYRPKPGWFFNSGFIATSVAQPKSLEIYKFDGE